MAAAGLLTQAAPSSPSDPPGPSPEPLTVAPASLVRSLDGSDVHMISYWLVNLVWLLSGEITATQIALEVLGSHDPPQ